MYSSRMSNYFWLFFLCLSVTVANDSGKVQIVCIKSSPDIHWSTLGKTLDNHNTYVESSKYSKYRINFS